MGRDIGPKDKQSRRIGEKLFLKGARDLSPKSAVVKKAYPPGIHGPKGYGRKISEYGKQLLAKQKIKKMYRMRERQFHNYFNQARKKVRELGYKDLLDLDVKGSEEHKQLIREIYDSPQPLIKLENKR